MNSMVKTNKAAVISGGTRGLGREIAFSLHYGGYRVAVSYLNSEEPAQELGARFGHSAMLFKTDVGNCC